MQAKQHAILTRQKLHPAHSARLSDFTLEPEEVVSASLVLSEPGWTLYCHDQANKCAVFVHTPPDTNLTAFPFLRMAQFQAASHVLFVPWQNLEILAAQVALPENMIFIFNIGRSGTTLVANMLDVVEGVIGLSEPNAQFDLSRHRAENGPELTRKLIAATTRLLCKMPSGQTPPHVAFKFYSQSLFNVADYYAAFPNAKFVFLYREGVAWANSAFKMTRSYGNPEILDEAQRRSLWEIISSWSDIAILNKILPPRSETHLEELLAVTWAWYLETYQKALDAGLPILPLRYDEIKNDREVTTGKLLQHCGLPLSALPAALKGFENDSQEGSGIGQDNQFAGMGEEARKRFLARLALYRPAISANVKLPSF